MEKEQANIMSFLLQHREMFNTDGEFCDFIVKSLQALARDLRGYNLELSVRQTIITERRSSRDWNYLKIGCE